MYTKELKSFHASLIELAESASEEANDITGKSIERFGFQKGRESAFRFAANLMNEFIQSLHEPETKKPHEKVELRTYPGGRFDQFLDLVVRHKNGQTRVVDTGRVLIYTSGKPYDHFYVPPMAEIRVDGDLVLVVGYRVKSKENMPPNVLSPRCKQCQRPINYGEDVEINSDLGIVCIACSRPRALEAPKETIQGTWYCESCRKYGDGPSSSHVCAYENIKNEMRVINTLRQYHELKTVEPGLTFEGVLLDIFPALPASCDVLEAAVRYAKDPKTGIDRLVVAVDTLARVKLPTSES